MKADEIAMARQNMPEKSQLLSAVMAVFAAFPSQNIDERTSSLRGQAFLLALKDTPLMAIKSACEQWILNGDGKGNLKYAPTPAELREKAKKYVEYYEMVERNLRAIACYVPEQNN